MAHRSTLLPGNLPPPPYSELGSPSNQQKTRQRRVRPANSYSLPPDLETSYRTHDSNYERDKGQQDLGQGYRGDQMSWEGYHSGFDFDHGRDEDKQAHQDLSQGHHGDHLAEERYCNTSVPNHGSGEGERPHLDPGASHRDDQNADTTDGSNCRRIRSVPGHQDIDQGSRDDQGAEDKKPRARRNEKGHLYLERRRINGQRGSWWNIFQNL